MLHLGCFLQQGEEGHSHEEELRDVGSVCVDPVIDSRGFVIKHILLHFLSGLCLGLLCIARNACVVDEDTETFLARLDLLDQLGNLVLRCDVGRDWNNFASNALSVGSDNVLELLLCTSDDIDLGTVNCKSLCRN